MKAYVLRRRALLSREEKGEGELKTEFALLLILPLKSLFLYKFYAFISLRGDICPLTNIRLFSFLF
jgi:hypothetical protein